MEKWIFTTVWPWIVFVLAVVMMIWVLFLGTDPKAFLKKSWLWIFTYQKQIEPAADGKLTDPARKLYQLQQTWWMTNLMRMFVIITSTWAVHIFLNLRLNGWCLTGYIAFGLQIVVMFITTAIVHTAYGLFSPCLAYTSESSWSDVFWFNFNSEMNEIRTHAIVTFAVFGVLLTTAIVIPLALHFTDETLQLIALAVVLFIVRIGYGEYRREQTYIEERFAEYRTRSEKLMANLERTQEEIAAQKQEVSPQAEIEAQENAKKLAEYPLLIAEREGLLLKVDDLLRRVDALFAERKKYTLMDAQELVRVKVLIEMSKGEIVSPKLAEARSVVIGILYRSTLDKTEIDSIELAVCRDLKHTPVKN